MQPTPTTPPDVTVVFPGAIAAEIAISMSPVLMQQWKQIAVTEAMTEYAATIERQKSAMAAMEAVNGQQAVKLREAVEVIAEQSRRIALLEKPVVTLPPVVIPPAPPVVPVTPPSIPPGEHPFELKPVINRHYMNNVAGFCITLGEDPPSATVDAQAREFILLGKRMGFKCARFYRNKDEVRADVKRTPEDLRNLYAFCLKNDIVPVSDTVDRAALELSDTELKEYLAGLKQLGSPLYIFNDANQYRGKKKDGTPYPPMTLENMVKRVRTFQPDMPIMASVTAGAKIEDYRPLFEYVEAQTFGKTTELDSFLDRDFDAFCLDGQASVSLDYLRKAHDIILKDNPAAFWYYTASDEKTDWRNMTDKTALIEKTVKAWNAARLVKA